MTAGPVATGRRESRVRLAEAVRSDPRLRERATRRLGVTEKARLGLEILLTYARARRDLRTLPLVELLDGVRRGVVDSGARAWLVPDEHVTAMRLGRAVARLLPRAPGDTRCLTQALVLTAMLARRGIGSTLVIAVAPGVEFQAHAWVEHGGAPLLPAEGPDFGRLLAL